MPVKDGILTTVEWMETLKDRRDELTDPVHIAMMETYIKHVAAEYVHDWDVVMATMVPDGVSRSWGGGALHDVLGSVLTTSERHKMYLRIAAEAGPTSFKNVAMETERFFVGDDGIAMDGVLWNVVPGDEVSHWGVETPAGSDPNSTFAIGTRMMLMIPFRDGLMVGEDHYMDCETEVVELDGPLNPGPLPEWVKLKDD